MSMFFEFQYQSICENREGELMVSIIIPVYNVEKYLAQCLDSVVNQTYKNLEIIPVDDGSPDSCGKICDQYAVKDNRITVIHKENGGLSDARNAGLKAAHGEYVYFLDSDDYLREDAIQRLVDRSVSERAEIVFFDCETVYEDYEDSEYREDFVRNHDYSTDVGARVLIAQKECGEYCPCVPLLFFRKDFLEAKSLCFEKGMMHEDELFTALAFIRSKCVAQEKERLYFRRLRANSIMSGKASKRSFDGLAMGIDKLLNERAEYSDGSIESEALGMAVKSLADGIMYKYLGLEANERKAIKPQVKAVGKKLSAVKCFGNKKLALKYRFLGAYEFYAKHVNRG